MDGDPRQTQEMTTAGLNLIQQALSIYDSNLSLVVSNRRFQEMFDLPDRLVTPGASFEDTIRFLLDRGEYGEIGDTEAAVRVRVEQARAFEPHYMERTRSNGRTISVEGSPLPQGGWVTVYTDITRSRQQEALLRARSEELSDQLLGYSEELAGTNRKLESTVTALEEAKRQLTKIEARTRLTTEMMPAHIAHVGADRRYTYSNQRLNAILPGRPSAIIGKHIRDALGDHAYSAIRKRLDAAFAGQPSVFEFTDEDSSRRIRVAFTPDDESAEGGVYILSMDVTEETQTRNALQQTRRRELAAQLTSGLAHDFSNLLTIILGMQSKLQRMALPGGAQELVAATLSAAHRGGGLLNQLADITGTREWSPAPTELRRFLDDLETLASAALPRDITLKITNSIPHEALMLDTGILRDALLNLILNARDACGTAGRITLSAEQVQDTWVEFAVSDSGGGFTDAALKQALQPFFTTKGGEGSGLGLAMVYDMTKLAGGRMFLENKAGGARVVLRLPLRPAAAPAVPGLVLLVEDSPDLRATVREMLTGLGHSVVEAASVDEALLLVGEIPDISLVLSDISLEGEATGLDLLNHLPDNRPPCLLMTSLPTDHPLRRSAAGRAPVLSKPFNAEQLSAFLLNRAAS